MRATVSALFLSLLLAPLVSRAELAAWDQDRVTGLAKELKEKSDSLYDTYYKLENATIGGAGAGSTLALKDQLRRIKEQTHHLAAALENGKGRPETEGTYKNLNELVHDAQESIRGMFTENDLLAAAMAAGDVLRRIAPYYDAKANEGPVSGASSP